MAPDALLVVFAGLPGTGKSSLARSLARDLRAAYLDKDAIRSTILSVADRMKIEAGKELADPLSYELLVDVARDSLTLNVSVVLDSPAAYSVYRDRVKQLARSLKMELHLIECVCSDTELMRKRIAAHAEGQPGIRVLDRVAYEQLRAQFERLSERRLVVDTAETLSSNLKKIKTYLGLPALNAAEER